MKRPGEENYAVDCYGMQFPEREDITVEWLRQTDDDYGRPNAHLVLREGYMNLAARGLLKHVIDLVDEDGDTTMHYVCEWLDALNHTPSEFLTPELLLVENKRGKKPIEDPDMSRMPWHRFSPAKWVNHIEELESLDEVKPDEEFLKFLRQVRAIRKLKSVEAINVEEVA